MLHRYFKPAKGRNNLFFVRFVLVMVRHIKKLLYFSQKITLRTPLDEVVSVEVNNEKLTIEVNILRKQHEFLFKKKDLSVIGLDGFSKKWGVFFPSDHALL